MRKFGTREWIAVGVALVAAGMLFFGNEVMGFLFGGSQAADTASNPAVDAAAADTSAVASTTTTMQNISTVKGLEIYDQVVGTGAEATPGKKVTVHYIGTFTNGQKFDSSVDRGTPFDFTLGAGQVIKGWDQGVAGMKVGGVRRLVISPELGYGSRDFGPIPGNSTLVFEVQLLDVK
ncbi:MAG TPA: FKBP-type peptidyl-prolyl cis-trans isomerase [Candidatus Paceibacterota bacterium]|nr:FKBP-type peptidyl-prolyl cis-trans isomerase [Candidatus Paceibacterota bacterium]